MYETDKIAILLAAYNGEKYIGEQIDSLLAQAETGWELYIHDDGSKDRTPEILDAYVRKDPARIHIVRGPACGGAKDNFFFLMRQVRAPYIMFCDQDDVWLPEKIGKTISRMKTLEEQAGAETPILVFSDLSVVDEKLNPVAERLSVFQKLYPDRIKPEELVVQNVVTGCTMMINRALAELAVRPEKTDDVIMHDWWCAVVAACFGKISFVNSPLMLYRQHGNNTVGAKKLGSWSYIGGRVRNFSGIQESLALTRRQSRLFAELYQPPCPLFQDYGLLDHKRKMQRLVFYAKNRVRMCGWQRNLGLIILG